MNRRHFLKLGGAAMAARVKALGARERNRWKIGVITDEISNDLEVALKFLQGYGLRYVEMRKVWDDVFVTEADDATIRKIRSLLEKYKMKVAGLASAHFKTTLPGTTPIVVDRDQFQLFNLTYQDQPALLERSLARAKELGAPYVRIFSFWRTENREALFPRIAEDLTKAAEVAAQRKMKLVLENEHTTNVATAAETARLLELVEHPALGLNWDAGNAFVAGDRPFPDGYNRLPKHRLWHTHVKDAVRDPQTRKHRWMPVGKGEIDYLGQFRALVKDGYRGVISLETHYVHPSGNKELATKESLEGLLDVLKRA